MDSFVRKKVAATSQNAKERDFANSSKKKLADRASAARKKKKSLASSSSFPRLASSDLAHEEMAIQRELQRAIGILR